jgi:HK97 family phage major capsid protein
MTMQTVTKSLRDELVKNHGLPADASDKEVKTHAKSLVLSKKISANRIAELMSDRVRAQDRADAANPTPEEVFGKAHVSGDGQGMDHNGNVRVIPLKEKFNCTKNTCKWKSVRETHGRKGVYEEGKDAFYYETKPGLEGVFSPAIETAIQKPILEPSEFEYAKMGALFKSMIIRDCGAEEAAKLVGIRLTELDEQLVKSSLHEDEWVGPGAGEKEYLSTPRKLTEPERNKFQKSGLYGSGKNFSPGWGKAPILNDSTSGGQQAVPQYFDFEAIRTPLLYGELVPFVEITPTDRGGSAHSYSIGTPTYVTTASGTTITAFDATSFVTTFDVTFFPVSCGILWGRDFEMDAAPNFGQIVVAQLGDQFKLQMDNWIAVGDGTTQPQGLVNASGTTSVTATGSSHATMVYNDGLNLVYGVTKPFRKAFGGQNTMFISTDKMYKKFMQLNTGVTGDTRPIYGMHLKDYQLGDYHFAVQNDIADGTVFVANLRGYRLYRRLGLYFELITTGQTLTLANEKLLFARARFGGKLTLGGYCAKMTSLQIG